MDKKSYSAAASLKILAVKILIFDVIILAVLLWGAVSFTAVSKKRIAEQISDSFRSSLLAGDNRHVTLDMTGPVLKDFQGVRWESANTSYRFSLPDEVSLRDSFFLHSAVIPVYFDEERKVLSGELHYYYTPYAALPWVFIVWIFLAGISVVVGYFEKNRLQREYTLLMELRLKESLTTFAAQVAHDIRSPLAALGAAAKGLSLPEDQRTLVDGAIGRMNGIADDLLRRYRAPGAAERPKIETHGLAGLIEQVVAEKRLQHKDKPGVKIDFIAAADGLKAAVEAKELQRLVSNLVNNSVEAFAGPGTVAVKLAAEDGKVLIEIQDDGKGIPPEILAKLGRKGGTHGKAGGTGLGLYHARTAAESWGGGLKITSAPGKGTAVVITLPAAARPAAGLRAVLLDDDALVHMNWRLAAKAAGADLKLFKTTQELAAAAGTLPRDIPLYIDSELAGGLKGEDIAQELHGKGFTDISMATGHSPEKFSHLPWLRVTGKEPPWA